MANHADGGMLFERGDDERELVGRPPIIAIEGADDVATALRDTVVESGGLAAIRLSKNADSWGKFRKNFGGTIGGAVIDNENLAVVPRIILRQGARNGLFD